MRAVHIEALDFRAVHIVIEALDLPACGSRIGTSSQRPVIHKSKPVQLLCDILQRSFPTVLLSYPHYLLPLLQAVVGLAQRVEVAHPQLGVLLVEDLVQVLRYPDYFPMSQVRVLVDQVDAGEEEFTSVGKLHSGGKVTWSIALDAWGLWKEGVVAFFWLKLVQRESSFAEDGTSLPAHAELKLCLPYELQEAGLLPTWVHLGSSSSRLR